MIDSWMAIVIDLGFDVSSYVQVERRLIMLAKYCIKVIFSRVNTLFAACDLHENTFTTWRTNNGMAFL